MELCQDDGSAKSDGGRTLLVDSSLSMSISPLAAVATNKFVITSQGATIFVTVVSFIFVRSVREAKKRAVGAAALFVFSAAASSAFGIEDWARASIVYPVDVLLVLDVGTASYFLELCQDEGPAKSDGAGHC